MSFPVGITVTLVSRTASGTDALGNDTFTTVQTTVEGCAYDPGTSTEQVQGQDLIVTQPTVYAPAGTNVTGIDAVIVGGDTFEVDGSPNNPQNPWTGWQPCVVIRLKRATG